MKQSLKVMVVLGVTKLDLNSCRWLLWSYVVGKLCLDTDKAGCVKSLYSIFFYFLKDPKYPLAADSEKDFGLYMFIISSCGWLLWSYLIDIVCLDGDKTGFVEVDPPLNILVFFERPQMNTCGRLSK